MSSVLGALWRIIFCSIAVSCTLSRINAHGQRLDRIKDLICVLFLSGLQKEDLDVNLLIKLQRYNIDIKDINNEELRYTCGSEKLSTPSVMAVDLKQSHDENTMLRDRNIPFRKDDKNIGVSEKKTDNRRILDYTVGQPDIKSVMNFWRTMAQHSDRKGTNEVHEINTSRAQELKSDIAKINFHNDINETEIINKIITDNKKNQHKISREIMPDKYNFNAERIEIGHKAEPIYFNVQPPHYERNLAFKTYKQVKYENKMEIPTEQKLDDILKTINQFKSMLSNINPYINDDSHKAHDTHNTVIKLSKVEKINDPVNKVVLSPQNLTDELVQKIAQSVKDMVLRDLRKEMQITTTTTHKVETASIVQRDNLYNEENIMTKVMSMLQSLNINGKKAINTSRSGHTYQVNDTNTYEQPLKQRDINQHHTSNLTPQIRTDPKISKRNILRPITFQTNSLEIPPLGIPLTHGQNPINQNIVVTTSAPFKIHYESDNGPSYSDSALMKVYPKEVIQSPLSAKFSKRSDDCPWNRPCNHRNEDVIRFRIGNDGKTKYDTDLNEKINLERIKPNNDGHSPRAPRFHEKLERADRYEFGELSEDCCRYPITQQMVECCNERITSRQQASLGKKRASYDDTHFRNFLKTQQKVTDMLEQILASKTRDLPVSVETT